LRAFLDVLYGGGTGFCHVVYGKGWYRNDNGKLVHRFWSERRGRHAYPYPADADAAVAKVLELSARGLDVYVSTSLMRTATSRGKNNAAGLWCLHADVDHATLNLDVVADQGWCAIASGTPGHVHLYAPLGEPVTEAQFGALQNALVDLVGGDTKKAGNDVLRPPWTYNFKPTVDGADPLAVQWAVLPTGLRISPRTLAAQAGVDFDHPAPPPSGSGAKTNGEAKAKKTGERAKAEEFDLDKFPGVKAALNKDSGDRSADTYGVMGVCLREGLTFAQACWALYQSPRLTERLDEREDYEIDLLRCWLRAVDDQQRKAGENSGKADPGGFEQDVSVELRKLRVREEARHRLAIEKAGDAPPFEAMLLADTPLFSQESFRIEGLLPTAASMVINAQHKTGKTTLTLNMALSMITGEPFLGRFCVKPVDGRVAILNYEVSGEQLGHWARQAQIPQDRLLLVNLRGRRNPFAYPDDLKRLAALLKGQQVESLIVDPFGQAYPGTNQDSSGEVSAWLTELDRYARSLVGAVDLIVTVHAGWNQERARGSSALGDWPDSILYLTRENTDDRYLRATGRDVSLDEDKLIYQPDIRRLTLSGTGGRNQVRQAKKEDKPKALILPVRLYVYAHPGASTTDIIGGLRKLKREGKLGVSFGFRDGDVRDAIELADKAGNLRRESEGEGKPTYHYPLTTPDDDSGRGEGGDHHGTPDDPGQTPDVRSP